MDGTVTYCVYLTGIQQLAMPGHAVHTSMSLAASGAASTSVDSPDMSLGLTHCLSAAGCTTGKTLQEWLTVHAALQTQGLYYKACRGRGTQPCGERVFASARSQAHQCRRRQLLLVLSHVDAILGMSWLTASNPDVIWRARTCKVHTATWAVLFHAANWDDPVRDPELGMSHHRPPLLGAPCSCVLSRPCQGWLL